MSQKNKTEQKANRISQLQKGTISLRREKEDLKKELKLVKALLTNFQRLTQKTHFSLTLDSSGKIRWEGGKKIFQEWLGLRSLLWPPEPPASLMPDCHKDFKDWWQKILQGKEATADFHMKTKKGQECWVRAFGYPLLRRQPNKSERITGFFQDITREKKLEAQLKESENTYRRIIEEAVEGFFQSTPDGHFLRANKAMARILGYDSPEELINSPQPLAGVSYVHPEKREEYKRLMEKEGQVRGFIFQVSHPDGRRSWLLENSRAIRDEEGNILYYEGHVQDITTQKEIETSLFESQARLESLINAAPDIIYFKNKEGKYLIVNQAFERAFCWKKEDIVGKGDEDILPPELAFQCRLSDAAAVNNRRPTIKEERIKNEMGQEIIFETIKAPVFAPDGSLTGIVGISRDITRRRKAEEELRSLLREKEILLREIHHRVKNNMQVISSLLSLQAQKLGDSQAVQSLRECQERIQSMALVHDQLYQQESYHRIEFSSYLRRLASHLFRAYKTDASLIQLRMEAEEIHLSINTAIPCGLIVNELVTNALKHAFSPGQKGEIIISLRQRDHGQYILQVKDNGRGLPPDVDLNQPGTFGLEIVKILATQLGSSLEVNREGGTEFCLSFEDQAYQLPGQ